MTGPQWVNIDDEGAVHALLDRLAAQLDVNAIDTIWLFPTRRASGVESTVVVISAFDSRDDDRRRVGAVRWLVTRDRRGSATVSEEMHEYATAPADALDRVVDGVMRRLGDDTRDPPRAVDIGGSVEAWEELRRELGAPPKQLVGTSDADPSDTPVTAAPEPDPIAGTDADDAAAGATTHVDDHADATSFTVRVAGEPD